MSETEVMFVKNPVAYDLMEVRDFLARALEASLQPDKDAEIEELREFTGSPYLHVLMAKRDGQFVGMAVVILPATSLSPCPEVYHIYNEGDPQDRRTLVDAVVAFVKDNGYSALTTANLNGREKAFKRIFRGAGPATKIGVMYRFDLVEKEEWAASREDCSVAEDSPEPLRT